MLAVSHLRSRTDSLYEADLYEAVYLLSTIVKDHAESMWILCIISKNISKNILQVENKWNKGNSGCLLQ